MTTTEITLDHPFQSKGADIATVSLRRPQVRDLVGVESIKGDMKKSIAMLSNLSGLEIVTFHDMDVADFKKCSKVVEGFLEVAQAD